MILIEESHFRKIEHGYVFFPYGIFPLSYKISEDEKVKLLAFLYRAELIGACVVAVAIGLEWKGLILLIPTGIYYHWGFKRILRNPTRTSERLTLGDLAAELPKWFCFFWVAFGLLTTSVGLFMSYSSYHSWDRSFLIGIVCTIGFGAFLAMGIIVLRLQLFRK